MTFAKKATKTGGQADMAISRHTNRREGIIRNSPLIQAHQYSFLRKEDRWGLEAGGHLCVWLLAQREFAYTTTWAPTASLELQI